MAVVCGDYSSIDELMRQRVSVLNTAGSIDFIVIFYVQYGSSSQGFCLGPAHVSERLPQKTNVVGFVPRMEHLMHR